MIQLQNIVSQREKWQNNFSVNKYILKYVKGYGKKAWLPYIIVKRNAADVRHIIIHSTDELYRLQKSKYVQSRTDRVYKELQTLLKNGEKVLFSGTPCQVEAAKTIAKRFGGELYTIDIICHGVPSNRFFSDFISCETEKRKIKISAYNFRDKKYGWGLDGSVAGKDLNDAEVEGVVNLDTESYYHYFLSGEVYRDCCYQCPYAQR